MCARVGGELTGEQLALYFALPGTVPKMTPRPDIRPRAQHGPRYREVEAQLFRRQRVPEPCAHDPRIPFSGWLGVDSARDGRVLPVHAAQPRRLRVTGLLLSAALLDGVAFERVPWGG